MDTNTKPGTAASLIPKDYEEDNRVLKVKEDSQDTTSYEGVDSDYEEVANRRSVRRRRRAFKRFVKDNYKEWMIFNLSILFISTAFAVG